MATDLPLERTERANYKFYLALMKKGAKIPINDVWIAACCMEVGGTFLTRDKHFEYVDQVESVVL